jgi:hypothetical protein
MKVVLPDGEVCEGDWKVSAAPSGHSATIQRDALAPVWDRIYGQGFYTAHILGEEVGQATLKGNKGTTLSVEIKSLIDTKHDGVKKVQGVAEDNNKNIYKLAD